MVVGQRALAGLRLHDRHARGLGELAQRIGRLGIDGAAAGDDQRPPRSPQQRCRLGQRLRLGDRPANPPDPLLEELLRPVERLGLHVLRQRQRHGAGVDRIGQHAHRGEEARGELLGTVDAIEEARHRPEGVVDRHVERAGILELLKHRARHARREDVARQQQHGQPVDRRQRRAGHHVRRAGPDGRGARPGREPVAVACERRRRVHHALLVSRQHVRHLVGLLQQRLADARHVAVAEDAEAAGDQPLLDAVALGVLVRQEAHQRLADRQPHACLLADVIGSRGSSSCPAHVSRIQPCAGSSVKRHARSPGPAITFR
jgi:hypothetical protein